MTPSAFHAIPSLPQAEKEEQKEMYVLAPSERHPGAHLQMEHDFIFHTCSAESSADEPLITCRISSAATRRFNTTYIGTTSE